jgi:hypothetical protein
LVWRFAEKIGLEICREDTVFTPSKKPFNLSVVRSCKLNAFVAECYFADLSKIITELNLNDTPSAILEC